MARLKLQIVPVTPFQQNCALLFDADARRGVVVDPGGDVDAILTRVAELRLTVESILLTHGHIDHAGGATALQERLPGKPPIVGPDKRDEFLLQALIEQGAAFGLDDARDVTPDHYLAEGDKVAIAGIDFDVLHCPGHTPGHVVFVSPSLRFAVLGDVLFHGSVGRTDLGSYGNHDQLIASITTKLLPLGDDINFICGHGPGSTIGEERRTNPFLLS